VPACAMTDAAPIKQPVAVARPSEVCERDERLRPQRLLSPLEGEEHCQEPRGKDDREGDG
jgi:hypothetical protein